MSSFSENLFWTHSTSTSVKEVHPSLYVLGGYDPGNMLFYSIIAFFLSSLPFLAPSCPLPPPLFRHACEAALLCPCIAALPPGRLRVALGTGLRQSPSRPFWGEPVSPLPAAPSSPRSSQSAHEHCTTFAQTLPQLVLRLEICSVFK